MATLPRMVYVEIPEVYSVIVKAFRNVLVNNIVNDVFVPDCDRLYNYSPVKYLRAVIDELLENKYKGALDILIADGLSSELAIKIHAACQKCIYDYILMNARWDQIKLYDITVNDTLFQKIETLIIIITLKDVYE